MIKDYSEAVSAKSYEVSITEIGSFLDCRRKWYLGSQYIHPDAPNERHRGIERAGVPDTAFWFGTLIHAALETFYKLTKEGEAFDACVTAAKETYESEAKEIEKKLQSSLHLIWGGMAPEFHETLELGREMLRNYFLREKMEPVGKEVLIVEERYRKRFTSSSGVEIEITGRFDLVVKDRYGAVWIVDHKTASQKPWLDGIEIDNQLTGYVFLYYAKHGTLPRGAVYNVLLKTGVEHKTLANGVSLSQDKRQRTTFTHFLAELQARKLSLAKYEGFLNELKSRGWSDFLLREGSPRSESEVVNFENRLLNLVEDMAEALQRPDKRYPNPGQFKCRGCQFVKLCKAYETGEDVDDMIAHDFQPREPRE